MPGDFDLQPIAYQNKNNGPNWIEIIKFIFFVVTMILIPLTKHGWRYGWLFVAWSVVIGGSIHVMLFESQGNIAHLIALPIYAVLLIPSIKYWIWRHEDNKLMARLNNPTRPSAPREMYDED